MKPQPASHDPLVARLEGARRFLLQAAAKLPEARWGEQPSPGFSPLGWHLGHVAAVQARWLLPGEDLSRRFGDFFDPARTPKETRTGLPAPAALRDYLSEVLEKVCRGLDAGRTPGLLGLPERFLVRSIEQHELQHAEHVQVIAALCEKRLHRAAPRLRLQSAARVEVAGGPVRIGCDDAELACDNERPVQQVELRPFWIDRAPVTVKQFGAFVRAGGYSERRHWSPEGWDLRAREGWTGPISFAEQHPDAPVSCLSWYEADAYARWAGARLPTEFEWEASGVEPGGVWEWTSSWFLPYPGFRPYPYDGYSKPWFGTHRVLRGASWATAPGLRRRSFRNWYEPQLRELPCGLRCAGDLA